jgi:hypothetical protein
MCPTMSREGGRGYEGYMKSRSGFAVLSKCFNSLKLGTLWLTEDML